MSTCPDWEFGNTILELIYEFTSSRRSTRKMKISPSHMYLLSQAISFILQTGLVNSEVKVCKIDKEFTCSYPIPSSMKGEGCYASIHTENSGTMPYEMGTCTIDSEPCHLVLYATSGMHTSFNFHVIPGGEEYFGLAISPEPRKSGVVTRAVQAAITNHGLWSLPRTIMNIAGTEHAFAVAFNFSSGNDKSIYLPEESNVWSVLENQNRVSIHMKSLSRTMEIIKYKFDIDVKNLKEHRSKYLVVTPHFLQKHQFKFIKPSPPSPAHFLIQYPDNTNPSLNS